MAGEPTTLCDRSDRENLNGGIRGSMSQLHDDSKQPICFYLVLSGIGKGGNYGCKK